MLILKFFKSPTCGPCKMFAPQIKKAIEDTHIKLEEYDVSTENGLAEAQKYDVRNSGAAILLNDTEVIYTWPHPVPSSKLIEEINKHN